MIGYQPAATYSNNDHTLLQYILHVSLLFSHNQFYQQHDPNFPQLICQPHKLKTLIIGISGAIITMLCIDSL